MNPTRYINFSEAYSFADQTITAVTNSDALGIPESILPDFFDFREPSFFICIAAPQQRTLLHRFIFEINRLPIQHNLSRIDGDMVVQDYAPLLAGGGIQVPKWLVSDQVEKHLEELSRLLDIAIDNIADAAFQLLYADRTFLVKFNEMLSRQVATLSPADHPCVIRPGEIARSTYLPVWLKNAVFHRDKGRCQICGCDLTNLFVPTEERHFDHMIPLMAHGTNDSTNYQLTCKACNLSKGPRSLNTLHRSYPWWQ